MLSKQTIKLSQRLVCKISYISMLLLRIFIRTLFKYIYSRTFPASFCTGVCRHFDQHYAYHCHTCCKSFVGRINSVALQHTSPHMFADLISRSSYFAYSVAQTTRSHTHLKPAFLLSEECSILTVWMG